MSTAPVLLAMLIAVVPSFADIRVVSTSVAFTTSSLSRTVSIVTPEPEVFSLIVSTETPSKTALLKTLAATAPEPAPLKYKTPVVPLGIS